MGRRLRRLRYWLRGEGEYCTACRGSHEHHVSIRCADCDRPFCPVCIVTVETDHLCPECDEERGRG